jgi:taurine dioxygenase
VLRLTRLDAPFGAVLAQRPTAADAAELRAALHEHQLLVLPGPVLSPADQLAVTALLGEAELPWDGTHAHPGEPRMEVFHASPRRPYRRPAEHWHTDGSFLPEPTCATLLHALVVPEKGGRTRWADSRGAYAALPAAERAALAGRRAVHSFGRQFSGLREASGRVSASRSSRERSAFPDVEHPLVRPHPVTGAPALYLNELCLDRVAGVPPATGKALLDRLYAHVLRPEFGYEHDWRPGDLVVWDNPSLLHRATPVAPGGTRLVHRTTARYAA